MSDYDYYPSPYRGESRMLGTLALPALAGCIAAYNNYYFHAGVWNVIRPGAFAPLLSNKPKIEIRVMHKPIVVLGKLTLQDAPDGLYGKFQLDDTKIGRDLIESLRRGFLTWLSFHLEKPVYKWGTFRGEECVEFVQVDFMSEVSFVDFPGQNVTQVGIDGENTFRQPLSDYCGIWEARHRVRSFLQMCGAHEQPRPPEARPYPTPEKPKRPATRKPAAVGIKLAATTKQRVPSQAKWQRVSVSRALSPSGAGVPVEYV